MQFFFILGSYIFLMLENQRMNQTESLLSYLDLSKLLPLT